MQEPGYRPPQYSEGTPIPSPTSYTPTSMVQPGRRVLRRVDVMSAFKVGAILSALTMAIFGLPYMFILSTVMSAMSAMSGNAGGGAALGGVGGYIMMIIFGGIFGGIGYAVSAALYNLISGWVGGIEVEVS